jgi:hypothetical protein
MRIIDFDRSHQAHRRFSLPALQDVDRIKYLSHSMGRQGAGISDRDDAGVWECEATRQSPPNPHSSAPRACLAHSQQMVAKKRPDMERQPGSEPNPDASRIFGTMVDAGAGLPT